MTEKQSIRDEMRGTIEGGIVLSRWDDEQIVFAAKITDLLMASSVIRRIQAEALRDAALSGDYGTTAQSTLLARADRIEGVKF